MQRHKYISMEELKPEFHKRVEATRRAHCKLCVDSPIEKSDLSLTDLPKICMRHRNDIWPTVPSGKMLIPSQRAVMRQVVFTQFESKAPLGAAVAYNLHSKDGKYYYLCGDVLGESFEVEYFQHQAFFFWEQKLIAALTRSSIIRYEDDLSEGATLTLDTREQWTIGLTSVLKSLLSIESANFKLRIHLHRDGPTPWGCLIGLVNLGTFGLIAKKPSFVNPVLPDEAQPLSQKEKILLFELLIFLRMLFMYGEFED